MSGAKKTTRQSVRLFKYFLRKIISLCLSFVAIIIIVFALVHLVPGDPTRSQLDRFQGTFASNLDWNQQKQRRTYFLDLPIFFNANPRWVMRRAESIFELFAKNDLSNDWALQQSIAYSEFVECGTACFSQWQRICVDEKLHIGSKGCRGVYRAIRMYLQDQQLLSVRGEHRGVVFTRIISQ